MTESLTAEIVTFRAAPGIDAGDLKARARAIEPWLAARPGFLARTLSQGEDGVWTDHVLWASHEAATAAGALIMAEPLAAAFMQAIDPASVRMTHAPVALRQVREAA